MFESLPSLSLDTTKLVHSLPAARVVLPVILTVAVRLSADTSPTPVVTVPSVILPVVKP